MSADGHIKRVQIAAGHPNLNPKKTFVSQERAKHVKASAKAEASRHTKCLPYTGRILITLGLLYC